MTADPNSLASLTPGDRIEALRRRMASIPARTDGAAAPAVPTEHIEARFETRPETITESATSVLEVPPALADLLPRGGLARGSVVSADGASSVLLSLLASVTGSGKHAAIIGLPKLGLLAATEMGADGLRELGTSHRHLGRIMSTRLPTCWWLDARSRRQESTVRLR